MMIFCEYAIMTPASEASMAFCVPVTPAPPADGGFAEIREQHVAERTVHGLCHELGQQRAGRTDHGAGDDHGGVVEHEAFESDREAGERVVQGNDHRHVGAADGQGHGDAQQQGEREEQGNDGQAGVRSAARAGPP